MPSTSNFDLTYNQQNVVAGGALSNPAATTGTSAGSGVTKIIQGTNVAISPTSGVGDVTISATGGTTTTGQSILAGNNSGGFQNVSLTGLNYDTTSHTLSTTNNGNVVGPSAGATDGNVPLYDGTTGKLIKNGPAPNITIAGTSTALGGSISQDTITGLSATAGIVKHTSAANTLALATAGTDYSTGTSSLATGIVKSTTSTGALSIAAASDINSTFGSQTAKTFYAAPNGSSGTPSFRAIVASDVPTLNQSTTGSAATLTTGRTIAITGDLAYTSPAFDGSGNVTATSTLAAITTAAGPIGSSTVTPVITIDAKGRVTALSSATIATGGLPSGGSTSKSLLYGTSSAGWYLEHFNVKAFGATGDGSTDDHTAINSAIAALNTAGGGELYFPYGTYNITTALTTITVPCKIQGDGMQCTTIKQSSTTAGVFILATSQACVIRDINVTSATTSSGYGISINPTNSFNTNSLVNNVSIEGFSICLYLNVAFSIVDGCVFGTSTTCVYYTNAILPDESCGTIINCTFNAGGSGTQCIYMEADGLQIMNNYFYAGASYAIVYNTIPNCTNVSDLWIQNNHIEGYSVAGVYMKSTSGYPFSNVLITNNEFSPIVNSTANAITIDAQGTAPAWSSGAYYLQFNVVSYSGVNYLLIGATSTTAGSFVTGRTYKITSVGSTDFTLIGSPSNTPGVVFTATGAGSGSGTATNYTGTTPPSSDSNYVPLAHWLQDMTIVGNTVNSGTTGFSLNGINNASISSNSLQGLTYGIITAGVTSNMFCKANAFYGVTTPVFDYGSQNSFDVWTGRGVNVTQQNSGGTGFSVPNASETNISWNRSLYDDGSFYGGSSFWSSSNADRITIPANAYRYGIKRIQLTACINWDPNATGNRQIKIKDNNGNTYGGNLIAGGNTTNFASDYNSTLSCVIDLVSMGNPTYFFVTGTQDSGGSLNVRSSYGSFFCMEIKG